MNAIRHVVTKIDPYITPLITLVTSNKNMVILLRQLRKSKRDSFTHISSAATGNPNIKNFLLF